jgi:hypothetical protein
MTRRTKTLTAQQEGQILREGYVANFLVSDVSEPSTFNGRLSAS